MTFVSGDEVLHDESGYLYHGSVYPLPKEWRCRLSMYLYFGLCQTAEGEKSDSSASRVLGPHRVSVRIVSIRPSLTTVCP
jgi:hypothetical protein